MSTHQGNPRIVTGTVVSHMGTAAIKVLVVRRVKHKIGKIVSRKNHIHVHVPDNSQAFQIGDTVRVQECPPVSKLIRWKLLDVVSNRQEAS